MNNNFNINHWLQEKGFEQYAELFHENEITIEDLSEIATHDDLKEIGIKSFIHRKKILSEIAYLYGDATEESEQVVPSTHEISFPRTKEAKQFDSISNLNLNEYEQLIVNSYPYFIAFPYSEMLNEENPFLKIQLLKDVFLNTLKYLGLLTATEYLLSSCKSKQVNHIFREKLFRPQFGHWNHFIRETLAFLQDEKYEFMIPELAEAYNAIELGKGTKIKKYNLEMHYTDDFGDVKIIKQQATAIGGLINFRNRYIGHSVTLSNDKSKQVFEIYYPILLDLLKKLDFCIKYPMLKYNEGDTWELMGTNVLKMKTNIVPEHKTSKLWLQLSEGEQIPLIPFFILPKQYLSGVLDKVEMFVYEQFTGKRMVYFSPEQEMGETSGEVVKTLNSLLKIKEQEIIKKLSDITADEFKQIVKEQSGLTKSDLIAEKKVIDGIYQPRIEAENSIHQFSTSSKQIYFLSAEAGSGKTNLLNEINKNLENDGKETLFLRAGRFQTNTLKDELIHLLNVEKESDFSLSSLFNRKDDNTLFIILDGGNEHPKPEVFFQSCLDLLNEIDGVKLIISWRINTNKDLPALGIEYEHLLYNTESKESTPQKDVSLLIKYASSLNSLNKKELEGAWEFFTSHKSKKFKPQFSLSDIEYKESQFIKQLTNPLHLRIFLELHNSKGFKKTGSLLRIWPAWYKQLESNIPGANDFIQKLCAIMFEREQTILDIDSLFDNSEVGKQIRDLNIDSVFQKLLKRGMLTQYFKNDLPVLTFTIEAAWHYTLSLFLNELHEVSTGDGLVEVINSKKSLQGIEEASSLMLRDDIISDKYNRVQEILDNDESWDFVEICAPALAYAVENQEEKKVIASIENHISVNLLPVLLEVSGTISRGELLYAIVLWVSKSKKFEEINRYWKMKTYSLLVSISADAQERIQFNEKTIQLMNEILDSGERDISHDEILVEIISLALSYQGQSYNLGKEKGFEVAIALLIENEKLITNGDPSNYVSTLYYDVLGSIYDDYDDMKNAEKYFLESIQFNEKTTSLHEKNSSPYSALGDIYLASNQFENAEKYYNHAAQISELQNGVNHQDTVDLYKRLHNLYSLSGDIEKEREYFQKQENYFKSLILLYESHLGENNPDLTEPLSSLGKLYLDNNMFEDAELCFVRGLNICILNVGEEGVENVSFYSKLGTLYSDKEDYEKALVFAKKGLNINLKQLGNNHIQTAFSYQNMSLFYSGLSDYKNSVKYSEYALKSCIAIYGSTHQEVADCYYELGRDLYYNDQYEEAIANHQKALDIRIELFGKEYKDVSNCYAEIGRCYYHNSQYEEAIVNHKNALNLRIKLLGEVHEEVADCYYELGRDLYYNDQYEEAIVNHQKALDIRIELFGKEHEDVANCYAEIGRSYHDNSQYEEAMANHQKALDIRIAIFGENNLSVAQCYFNLGATKTEIGQYQESIETIKKSLDIRRELLEENNNSIAYSYYFLGNNYYDINEYEQSIENYNSALEIRISIFGKQHESVAKCYYQMGSSYYWNDQYEEAIINLEKALDIRIKLFGEENEDVADCYYYLGRAYYWNEQYEQAIVNHQKVLEFRINQLAEEHEDVANCYNDLGNDYYWAEQYEPSINHHKRAFEIRAALFGKKSEKADESRFSLGQAYYYADMDKLAEECFSVSLKFRKKLYGKKSKEYIKAKEWLDKI